MSQLSFQDFFNHEDPTVRQAAEILATAQRELQQGNITKEQFNDLAKDVCQVEQIDDVSSKLENKASFGSALNTLYEIASNLTAFL